MTDPKETAAALTRDLEGALEGGLDTVLLYGSVARDEAVAGVSDINVLVLADRLDAGTLRRLGPIARRWAEAGNTAPLLMAPDEWQRAADVFAIEVADMRDAHRVLHGRDPLTGLEVRPDELRLQAERELRGKLLQLREGLLVTAERPDEIGALLMAALPSFTTYLRTVLRLTGHEVPLRSEDAIRDAADVVDAEPDPFISVWRARQADDPVHAELDDPLVAGYYSLVERTAAFVDRLMEDDAA